jgi:hypothetical protein
VKINRSPCTPASLRGRIDRLPKIVRIGAAALLMWAVAGQWWQHQPAGRASLQVTTMIERACPSARKRIENATVADSARVLDRWAARRVGTRIDRLLGRQPIDRCAKHR